MTVPGLVCNSGVLLPDAAGATDQRPAAFWLR